MSTPPNSEISIQDQITQIRGMIRDAEIKRMATELDVLVNTRLLAMTKDIRYMAEIRAKLRETRWQLTQFEVVLTTLHAEIVGLDQILTETAERAGEEHAGSP